MTPEALSHAFMLEYSTGRLFWKNPPPNHREKTGTEAGYICKAKGKNKSYWMIRFGGGTFKRSQIVFAMTNGHWPRPMCDHINGDSLDDRPENLRAVTARQNAQNMKSRRKLSGLPLGVVACKHRFHARICINGMMRFIGAFATPEEASSAYKAAKSEAFGEYA